LGHFFHKTSYVLIFTINGFGYTLGDLFTNTSGHPAGDGNGAPRVKIKTKIKERLTPHPFQ
jgi:hypothetical protein